MKHSGHLVIIGGGERPLCVMQKIVELAGGRAARIVIIPTASEAPEEVASLQSLEFAALGVAHVDVIHCSRHSADQEANLRRIAQASGIFFSGGDQRKLTAALLGTRLLEQIRLLYAHGGVIAGTSAGAAVMSRVMITGDELTGEQRIGTADGFGFIEQAIIDQHFLKRGRHHRLLSLAMTHPELIGLGIDEATAVIVAADGTFAVLGDSQVVVFDPIQSAARKSTASGPKVHVLSSGTRYCLHSQLVLN